MSNFGRRTFSGKGEVPPKHLTAVSSTPQLAQQQTQPLLNQGVDNIGQPTTMVGAGGSTYYSSTVVLTMAVVIALLAGACIIIGVVVFFASDTKPCGTFRVPQDDPCVDVGFLGGGSTVLAAARRVTDDLVTSAMVLESGPDYKSDPTMRDTGDLLKYGGIIFSEPSKFYFQALADSEPDVNFRKNIFAGAQAFGGTSVVNIKFVHRGTVPYWDELDTMVGSPGLYTGSAMFTTFKYLEHIENFGNYPLGPYRGDGSISTQTWRVTSRPKVASPTDDNHIISKMMVDAFGIFDGESTSYNDFSTNIISCPFAEWQMDFDSPTFESWDARLAFMNPTVLNETTYLGTGGRKLEVRLRSHVTALKFHPDDPKRVIGAEYTDRNGTCHSVWFAHTAVVNMFWQTPMFLQRNGIGPTDVLADAGITPRIINEHVGRHMQIHNYQYLFVLNPNVTGTPPVGEPTEGSLNGFSFARIEDFSPAGIPGRTGFFIESFSVPGLIIVADFQARPLSEGNITVYSSDPTQMGRIQTGIFTDPRDITSWVEHLKYYASSVEAVNPSIAFLSLSPSQLANDTEIEIWTRENSVLETYHVFATTRMAATASGPSGGVVDPRFCVFGSTDCTLRVCDSQVLPYSTDANPATSLTGLGDVCGRVILEDIYGAKKRELHPSLRPVVQKSMGARAERRGPVHGKKDTEYVSQREFTPRTMTDEQMYDAIHSLMEGNEFDPFPPQVKESFMKQLTHNPWFKGLEATYGAKKR